MIRNQILDTQRLPKLLSAMYRGDLRLYSTEVPSEGEWYWDSYPAELLQSLAKRIPIGSIVIGRLAEVPSASTIGDIRIPDQKTEFVDVVLNGNKRLQALFEALVPGLHLMETGVEVVQRERAWYDLGRNTIRAGNPGPNSFPMSRIFDRCFIRQFTDDLFTTEVREAQAWTVKIENLREILDNTWIPVVNLSLDKEDVPDVVSKNYA